MMSRSSWVVRCTLFSLSDILQGPLWGPAEGWSKQENEPPRESEILTQKPMEGLERQTSGSYVIRIQPDSLTNHTIKSFQTGRIIRVLHFNLYGTKGAKNCSTFPGSGTCGCVISNELMVWSTCWSRLPGAPKCRIFPSSGKLTSV